MIFDLTLLARAPAEAARTAFFALRERLRLDPAISINRDYGADRDLAHHPIDSLSITTIANAEPEILFGFEHADAHRDPSPGTRRYRIDLRIWVTAVDREEALRFALDDLRDGDLQYWALDVTPLPVGSGDTVTVTFRQGLDY